jgi:integrase
MDFRTFRMFLLTLYATGMRTGEALTLLREDVDVNRSAITIRGGRFGRVRKIPIGPDLCVDTSAGLPECLTRVLISLSARMARPSRNPHS